MPQEECPFCQLISNPSQLKTVGETENFYAWLDINPRAKGYTMVVPKEHKESVKDFSHGEYQEAMKLTRKVVDKAEEGLGADGASVTMNMGEAAGQMVPHAYIQVFPRYEGEETEGTPTGAIFQMDEEAKENLDEIQDKMESVDSDFGESSSPEPHPDSKKFQEASKGLEAEGSRESKESREDDSEEPEEDPEPEKDEGDEEDNGESEDEVDRSGHWDGKSFEWR